MLIATEKETERAEHPVDVVEQLAATNDWSFDRDDEDEISISVAGAWTEYHVAFTWLPQLETLHVSCAFDLKVPERRRGELMSLVNAINEQIWIGHFDFWPTEGVVMHRQGLMLTGGAQPSATAMRGAARPCAADLRALLSGLPIRALGRQGRQGGARDREFRDQGRGVSADAGLRGASIALIGAGNMGLALLEGWAAQGVVRRERRQSRAAAFAAPSGALLCARLFAECESAARRRERSFSRSSRRCWRLVAPPIAPFVGRRHGRSSPFSPASASPIISARLPGAEVIVRAMPNTPAAIGRGITGAFASAGTGDAERALAPTRCSRRSASVEWVESEPLIDAVTAVSGSGPAYVFYLVECLAAAGVEAGLPEDLAGRLARATVEGAGELMHRQARGERRDAAPARDLARRHHGGGARRPERARRLARAHEPRRSCGQAQGGRTFRLNGA